MSKQTPSFKRKTHIPLGAVIVIFASVFGIIAILLVLTFQGSLDGRSNASGGTKYPTYRYPWMDPRANDKPLPSVSPVPKATRPPGPSSPPPGSGKQTPRPSSTAPAYGSPPPGYRLPTAPPSTPPPGSPPPGQSW